MPTFYRNTETPSGLLAGPVEEEEKPGLFGRIGGLLGNIEPNQGLMDFSLGLLANSGYSTTPRTLGEVMGGAAQYASQQKQGRLKNDLIREQINSEREAKKGQQAMRARVMRGEFGDPNQMLPLFDADPDGFVKGLQGQTFGTGRVSNMEQLLRARAAAKPGSFEHNALTSRINSLARGDNAMSPGDTVQMQLNQARLEEMFAESRRAARKDDLDAAKEARELTTVVGAVEEAFEDMMEAVEFSNELADIDPATDLGFPGSSMVVEGFRGAIAEGKEAVGAKKNDQKRVMTLQSLLAAKAERLAVRSFTAMEGNSRSAALLQTIQNNKFRPGDDHATRADKLIAILSELRRTAIGFQATGKAKKVDIQVLDALIEQQKQLRKRELDRSRGTADNSDRASPGAKAAIDALEELTGKDIRGNKQTSPPVTAPVTGQANEDALFGSLFDQGVREDQIQDPEMRARYEAWINAELKRLGIE